MYLLCCADDAGLRGGQKYKAGVNASELNKNKGGIYVYCVAWSAFRIAEVVACCQCLQPHVTL